MPVLVQGWSRKTDGDVRLTAHFTVREFACRDGSDPVLIAPALPHILEAIRAHFGGRPLLISSGYRTPAHNKTVGGSARSQHCLGTATDVRIRGIPPAEVAAFARELMPDFGGVGVYSTFTHIDVRTVKTDWKG